MRRSLFRPVAVLAMTGGLVVGTALPAFAHHPILSGTTACKASGEQVVTWTVKNSENDKSMTVKSVAITSGTVPNLLNSVFTPSQSKTFTTILSGTQGGTVKLTVGAKWTNNVTATRDTTVALKSNCQPPVTTTSSTSTTTTSSTTTTTTAPTTTTTTGPTTTTTGPTTTTTGPTTTTTGPTTTTTGPTTTTTGPSTTTTTAPSTTTTAPSVTTTTIPTAVLGETLTKADTPEVLAEQVDKPAPGGPLPHTGAAIGLLAFIGGALLWIGLPLSRYKRRQQHED